jgi:two-component system phosphate regulon sensor histidine kinase PhoR
MPTSRRRVGSRRPSIAQAGVEDRWGLPPGQRAVTIELAMTFSHWFWRLFLALAVMLAAYAAGISLLLVAQPGGLSGRLVGAVWLLGLVALAAAGGVAGYFVRQMVLPLVELAQQVRELRGEPAPKAAQGGAADQPDEWGLVAWALDQMQRDLARGLEQLQEHSQRLHAILSSMEEGVLAVAPDLTILLLNQSARRLLDVSLPQPVGRPLLEATRMRPVYEAIQQSLQKGESVVCEFDSPGVPRRNLSLRATPLASGASSGSMGVMVVLHDLTELRRLENMRRELVANVSHELKTPLAAIKAYAETLRLGAVNDPEHNLHFVQRIEEQADRLHALILDILQLARLESGQQSFEMTDVPVAATIAKCAEQFQETAAAKKIDVCTELPSPELTVWADAEGVETILNNLLDNALKYTPAGGRVVVSASAVGRNVRFEVQDNGIGIAPEEQERIFERFYRVDRARSRELGGTGLGLSIVKHLAHSFGGSVSVESQLGKGSIFRVELPRGRASGS